MISGIDFICTDGALAVATIGNWMFDARRQHRCLRPISELKFSAYPARIRIPNVEPVLDTAPDPTLEKCASPLVLTVGAPINSGFIRAR